MHDLEIGTMSASMRAICAARAILPRACAAKDLVRRAGTECIWSLNEALSILDEHDIIMPKDESCRSAALLRRFLLQWQFLAVHFHSLQKKRWKIRPKHHVLDHFADDLERTRLNPRLACSCFQEESFLGHLKKIAVHCSSPRVMERTFQRLLLLWGLRWQQIRELEAEVTHRPAALHDVL